MTSWFKKILYFWKKDKRKKQSEDDVVNGQQVRQYFCWVMVLEIGEKDIMNGRDQDFQTQQVQPFLFIFVLLLFFLIRLYK